MQVNQTMANYQFDPVEHHRLFNREHHVTCALIHLFLEFKFIDNHKADFEPGTAPLTNNKLSSGLTSTISKLRLV